MKIKTILTLSLAMAATASCKPRSEQGSAVKASGANEGDDAQFVQSCGESRLYVLNEKPESSSQETAIALTDDGKPSFGLADGAADSGKAAFDALEKNCASECHTKRTTSGKMGDVTNYTVALKFRNEIKRRVENNLMPPPSAPQPNEADRKTILAWATDPQPFPGQGGIPPLKSSNNAVGYRDDDTALDDSMAFISPKAQLACIKQDYARLPTIDRPFVRYVTFTHLYNAGVRKKDWSIMKKAFYKALNSVSRSAVIKSSGAIPIDTATMTLFRIDLRAYKIDPVVWDGLSLLKKSKVIEVNPYTIGKGFTSTGTYSGEGDDISALMPVRGDFLMREMLQRDKYYALLGITGTKDLTDFYAKRMGTGSEAFSLATVRNQFDAKRAIFNDSLVNNGGYRVVEKVEAPGGLAFNLFDFDRGVESADVHRDPTIAPLGPCFKGAAAPFAECGNPTKWTFAEDATETSFQLQNGLFAYVAFDRNGKLAQENKVTVDPINVEHKNVSGLSCISCHDVGLMPFRDAVGNQARKDVATKIAKKYYGDVTDVVARIHPDPEDFNDYINAANARYYTALGLMGIAPAEIQPEPIALVVSDFEKPLTRKRAAAEMGVSEDELVAAISSNEELRSTLAVFLNDQTLARDQWQDLFRANSDRLNSYFSGGASPASNGDGKTGKQTPVSDGALMNTLDYKGIKYPCPDETANWPKEFCDKAFRASRNGFVCVPCKDSAGWVMANLDTKKLSSCYAQSSNTVCTLSSSLARESGVCIPHPTLKPLQWIVFHKDGTTTGTYASKEACYESF